MPAFSIGVQLRSLKLPFRKAIVAAAQLGASAVELDLRHDLPLAELSETAIREVRKLLADLGLRISAAAFPTRRGYHDPEQLEDRVRFTKEAMLAAARLGAPLLVNHLGRAPSDLESPEGALMRDVLRDLTAYGARVGAILTANTGLESGPDLARLLAALPVGTLGVNLDPAGLESQGHSPLEAVAALGPAILQVHARDAVKNAGPGWGAEVALGRGTIDFAALLAALAEKNYRGCLTVVRLSAERPLDEIGDAVAYLRALQ